MQPIVPRLAPDYTRLDNCFAMELNSDVVPCSELPSFHHIPLVLHQSLCCSKELRTAGNGDCATCLGWNQDSIPLQDWHASEFQPRLGVPDSEASPTAYHLEHEVLMDLNWFPLSFNPATITSLGFTDDSVPQPLMPLLPSLLAFGITNCWQGQKTQRFGASLML